MGKLPVINALPIHHIRLEVMGKDVRYMPYTVAQDKMIVTAKDEGDTKSLLIANLEILGNNVSGIDIESIPLVDLFHLVSLSRAKSKGEFIHASKKECDSCKKGFEFKIDITDDAIKYKNIENKSALVKLSEDLTVEIAPLHHTYLFDLDKIKDNLSLLMHTASHCISKVIYKEEIFTDMSPEEIKENVVAGLSEQMLYSIFTEFDKLISIYLEIRSKCPYCGHESVEKEKDFLR